ncbi:Laccase-12 [Echinococcus multilocularis]|uniref:Laccase-12 n=1 Tax=Echinococcus multilocularis TaxID=6211 RepID=A0A0S4ML87_ECHMU|nr:Laccase-12 [Echinococcus multilocularis]
MRLQLHKRTDCLEEFCPTIFWLGIYEDSCLRVFKMSSNGLRIDGNPTNISELKLSSQELKPWKRPLLS